MSNEKSYLSVFIIILTILLIGAFFKFAATILVPLVVSFFVAFLFAPLLTFADKIGIPHWLSFFLLCILVIIFGYLIGLIFYSSFQAFLSEIPKYTERFRDIYTQLLVILKEKTGYSGDILSGIDWVSTVRSFLGQISSSLVSFLSSAFLVLLYLIFILLERSVFPIKINKLFKGGNKRRIVIILEHINKDIGKYIRIKTLISFATGLLIWISLSIIGVDFAFVWGVLAMFFNFIPNIGSIVIVILIILMSLIQFFPSSGIIIATGAIMTVIQLVIGNILDPRLQGARLNLSPLLILISLIIWGWIWGILGMFLAVPLTVTIKVICVNVPALRPIGMLMGTGKEKVR